jgi:hypothetical protein
MRPVFTFALTALAVLALQPAFAQTPSTMPPGTQNPALAQPRLVAPPVQLVQPPRPGPQPLPAGPQPGSPQPDASSPSALITPGGAGGLCECLNSHALSASIFDKTRLHQRCLTSAEACQAACNTQYLFSFVPHSIFTCPVRPGEEVGHVAMNTRPSARQLGAR